MLIVCHVGTFSPLIFGEIAPPVIATCVFDKAWSSGPIRVISKPASFELFPTIRFAAIRENVFIAPEIGTPYLRKPYLPTSWIVVKKPGLSTLKTFIFSLFL